MTKNFIMKRPAATGMFPTSDDPALLKKAQNFNDQLGYIHEGYEITINQGVSTSKIVLSQSTDMLLGINIFPSCPTSFAVNTADTAAQWQYQLVGTTVTLNINGLLIINGVPANNYNPNLNAFSNGMGYPYFPVVQKLAGKDQITVTFNAKNVAGTIASRFLFIDFFYKPLLSLK